jgi:hypothetical protein
MAGATLVEEAYEDITWGATTKTVTFAATPSDGRLILLYYTCDSATNLTRTWPSGFTEFISGVNGSSNANISAAWKVASGESGASYALGIASPGDNAQVLRGQVWSGNHATTPIDVVGSASSAIFVANGGTFVANGVTTTVADVVATILVADSNANATNLAATGFTDFGLTAGASKRIWGLYKTYTSAGATGNVTVTVTGQLDWSTSIMFGIRPVASSAQDTPELYGRPDGRRGAVQMQQLLAQ